MKKPLKTAAICGIILLAAGLAIGIFMGIFSIVVSSIYGSGSYIDSSSILMQDQFKPLYLITAIISLILVPFGIFFLYGFVVLGKKFKNNFVFVISWILIVLSILGAIIIISSIFTGDIYPKQQPDYNMENLSFSSIASMIKQSIASSSSYAPIFRVFGDSDAFFWTFFAVVTLVNLAVYIILGIGLLELKKNEVPLALSTGIFYLLTPFLAIFNLVASILAIIMFLKCSKKFEGEKKTEKIGEPVEKTAVKKTRKK